MVSGVPRELREKFCFTCAAILIVLSVYFYVALPSIILYIFSIVFIISMMIRVVSYWRSNYLLFMLDMCYVINTVSLIMVWAFPVCIPLRYVQFSLANSHAYWGSFLYRNALVLHDFQKLVSCFIHILPVVFSFLLRWFPGETSVLWYTSFGKSDLQPHVLRWLNDRDWLYQFAIPLLVFAAREVLYYLIVYGCVKPGENHLDTYRYMHKKKLLRQILWKRFDNRWHLLIWVLATIVATAAILCVAVLCWCNYLIHCIMIVAQLLVVCWNGACYYVDYYPVELQRRFRHSPKHGDALLVTNGKEPMATDAATVIPVAGEDEESGGILANNTNENEQ